MVKTHAAKTIRKVASKIVDTAAGGKVKKRKTVVILAWQSG